MDSEKKIDESWKETAIKEKEIISDEAEPTNDDIRDQDHVVEINFLNYITSLGFQALIFMGEIPNPITQQVEKNLIQSKFIIDTLIMLKDKTKGNLDEQEANLLESSVYDLQLKYIEVVKKDEEGAGSNSGEDKVE